MTTGLLLPALPLAQAPDHWLEQVVRSLTRLVPAGNFFAYDFNVQALLALLLVSLSCGAVGSLVVAGRMAFFSDALAHCAFAGVSIGFLVFRWLSAGRNPLAFWEWVLPVMAAYGVLVGLGIAFVRGRTTLTSDTVIGVFFAGNIGLYAMLSKIIHSRQLFNLEDFLFGNPMLVRGRDLELLGLLAVVTALLLVWLYNYLLLAGFNSSLALSRRVPVRLGNYLFIMLLALIVNLCLRAVGVLLINALLVVPAATAINLSRNLRQLFWLTFVLCLCIALAGQQLTWHLYTSYRVDLSTTGTIILLSVLLFVLSLVVGPWYRRRPAA
jgi:zinc transport system permease protein